MSGSQQNTESERQNLLDRLLDAVKQCQVRFGGKTELATDGDSRVVCLLAQFEAVFQHGFKKTKVSAFRQVGQVAGIVKLDPEAVFWSFVKVHLGKLDEERFVSLQKATTDAGRGRAWLRSALNEHLLEKYFQSMLGNKAILSQFYDKEAFLMDEERASMLPMIAAGLSPILFALIVDSEELNIVRQQPPPPLTINKEVFSAILPSMSNKPVAEPAPIYSAALIDDSKQVKRKKKKKKKLNPAIVSIEEDNSRQDFQSDSKDFSPNDCSVKEAINLSSDESKSSGLAHTFSSSYPGNITVVPEGLTGKSSCVDGQQIVFTEVTKSLSLPENSPFLENKTEVSESKGKHGVFNFEDFLENLTVEQNSLVAKRALTGESESNFVAVEPKNDILEKDGERVPVVEDTDNFVFGDAEFFHKHSDVDNKDTCLASPIQNNKQTASFVMSTSSFITDDAATVIQGSHEGNEKDLLGIPHDSGNDHFDTKFTSSFATQCSSLHGDEGISQNIIYDECDTNDNEKQESNFSFTKIKAASSDENFESRADHHKVTSNESQVCNILSAQEHHSHLDNELESIKIIETTAENDDFYETGSSNSAELGLVTSRGLELQSDADINKMESVFLMDSGECLLPIAKGDLMSQTRIDSPGSYYASDVSAEKDRDSLSSASWSYVDDGEDGTSEQKDGSVFSSGSIGMASDASTMAALAACSDAQRGMDSMTSGGFISTKEALGDRGVNEDVSKRHDSMSSGELKQAIVSMMLKKDEIEEENRSLKAQLDEERLKSQQLSTESEQLQKELSTQETFNAAKITSLSRENELLKHQLKKYVGAVQALRSNMQSRSPETTEVLSGIRQDEILPSLPPEKAAEEARMSEEAEEYKRKLIQVADLHGELLEFNERLHKQLNYYQYKVRRLREELVHLRGPLPDDGEGLEDDEASLSDFDPAVMSVGTRPLVNVWIPSVFLRGRTSNVHHVYQVYVRIKDDEWNVYRRYSQFFDMHKCLRRKFPMVEAFKFPPKKTLGNKDSLFVEDRRRLLQDYLRRVVNLYVTTDQQLRENTTKTVLLQIVPFFADPFPPEKSKKEPAFRRKRSLNYTGL